MEFSVTIPVSAGPDIEPADVANRLNECELQRISGDYPELVFGVATVAGAAGA
jgi:hypothetical protein